MTTKVFVDGQEGTTGLKIFEYLSERRDIEVLRIDEAKRKDVGERHRSDQRLGRDVPLPAGCGLAGGGVAGRQRATPA